MVSRLQEKKDLAAAARSAGKAAAKAFRGQIDEAYFAQFISAVTATRLSKKPLNVRGLESGRHTLFAHVNCPTVIDRDRNGNAITVGSAALDLLASIAYRAGLTSEDLVRALSAEVCYHLDSTLAKQLFSEAQAQALA